MLVVAVVVLLFHNLQTLEVTVVVVKEALLLQHLKMHVLEALTLVVVEVVVVKPVELVLEVGPE